MASIVGKILNRPPVPLTSRRRSTFNLDSTAGGSGSNPVAQMRAMGAVGTLFSIVNRTSNATAMVNWRMYRKEPETQVKGGKIERQEITKHAALSVWQRPNGFMPGMEFREVSQQHMDLVGETFWVVGRSPDIGLDIPLELWPIRPDRMAPVKHATRYLTGWIYTDPDGQEIPLGLDEVIYLRMPNPLDNYRGMGPVQAIMTELDSARYSAEWNRNFFLNSAAPGGVVEVDKRMSDEEFDEFQLRWEEAHKGVARAHRVALLEQGKWVNRAFSQRDMQFAELRNVTRDTIMEAFGIHRHLLGIAEDVNRANAEAAAYSFARWLIEPRLNRIRDALNHEFLPLFGSTGQGVEFDYDSPVEEDGTAANLERDSKVKALTMMVAAGFDETDVLDWLELPRLGYTKPEIPAPVTPGAKPPSKEGSNGSKSGAEQKPKPASPAKP